MDISKHLSYSIDVQNGKIPFIPTKEHFHKRVDFWTMAGFREDEIHFNPRNLNKEFDKYKLELKEDLLNNRHTTPLPTYFTLKENILTLIGLTESAKRDTGETDNTTATGSLNFISLGSNATTETTGDTDLGTEFTGGTPTYARKNLDSTGSAEVTNQTAKYAVLWDDTDIDVTPSISVKEAGLHWGVSGSSNIHAHVTFTTFTFDAGDLFVIQISELMENG